LHPSHGEKLFAQPTRGQRYISGQGSAPDQVYYLSGLARGGQVIVHGSGILEGFYNLVLDYGAVSDPVRLDLGLGLLHYLQGLYPDQLSLAVIVGGDGDLVSFSSQLLQRRYDLLLDRPHHYLGTDQILAVHLLPVVVIRRVVDTNYMAG